MKNLDIEKFERKTPYKVPEIFFREVQSNVLSKAGLKQAPKEAKVFRLNFAWLAAAAVAIIFGLGIFFLNYDTQKPAEKTVAVNQIDSSSIISELGDSAIAAVATQMSIESQPLNPYKEVKKEISNPEASVKQVSKPIANISNSPRNENATDIVDKPYTASDMASKDQEIEAVLANFSSDDLRQVSKNTEQDLYLDLYN